MSERASHYIRLGIYEYNPADVLGSGAFAIVYKGRFREVCLFIFDNGLRIKVKKLQ